MTNETVIATTFINDTISLLTYGEVLYLYNHKEVSIFRREQEELMSVLSNFAQAERHNYCFRTGEKIPWADIDSMIQSILLTNKVIF